MAYDVVGTGPGVLFVHGMTNSRRAWDPITDRLRADYTCVRVDLRGHGESSPGDDYELLSMVADVHAVVEDLSLSDPAVVGHSLGASVAAVYAMVHPARAVVTVDQTLRLGDFADLIRPHADRLQGGECMQAVIDIEHALGIGPYSGADDLERRVLAFPPEIVRALWAGLLTAPGHELTALMEAGLRGVTAPLLALHGSPPPADYETWLTRFVPTAEVEVWDGSGHFLHLVEPERFAARLRAFL